MKLWKATLILSAGGKVGILTVSDGKIEIPKSAGRAYTHIPDTEMYKYHSTYKT